MTSYGITCVIFSDFGTRELISWYVNEGRGIGILLIFVNRHSAEFCCTSLLESEQLETEET